MKHKQAAEAANYVAYKSTNLVPSRPVSQLDDRHKDHLVRFFDKNKRATIEDAVNSLTQSFAGIQIKKTRMSEFMKDECNLSIKVISRHPTARNSPAVIEKRAVWVKEWLEKGMIYLQNCVFLDESGFDINMTRERAWSTRGEPAVVETLSGRATFHTVLGAISSVGVLPSYSTELNPIEDFWSIVKSKVKHHALKDTETLTSKIIESCEEVPLHHLQNCIQHSVVLFDKCLNKEPI
ncbi:hypothetical protein G6F37_000874 [Rhizopus arrhizus]|nr:hypothetical protein G6F38_002052 [Rhizopus arrhizus]KAG1163805.1 hypothetical protein G6F37_000874 [Rhizopus arrhizus]